jgi:hypothetical protein
VKVEQLLHLRTRELTETLVAGGVVKMSRVHDRAKSIGEEDAYFLYLSSDTETRNTTEKEMST